MGTIQFQMACIQEIYVQLSFIFNSKKMKTNLKQEWLQNGKTPQQYSGEWEWK